MHVGDRNVPLNSTQVKTKKPGAHADGGGLYLHVRESGERVWAFRFTAPNSKRAVMEFAVVGDRDGQLGLSEARDQARAYRLALKKDGVDSRHSILALPITQLASCSDKVMLYNIEMTLGKRIKAARERLRPRVTQAKIGALFGISDQAVSGLGARRIASRNRQDRRTLTGA